VLSLLGTPMLLPLLFAVTSGVNINPDGMPPGVHLSGQLRGSGGIVRSAGLRINCFPPEKSLLIELTDLDAGRGDIDYRDFAGADAAAKSKPLSHVSWNAAGQKTAVSSAATGAFGYAPSFVFTIDDRDGNGAAATLLHAIGNSAGTLEWLQNGFDDPRHSLSATFAVDAEHARLVRDLVSPCLSSGQGG